MTHILVTHRVNDYATWKKVFDEFVETRKSFGEKTYQILHPTEDPNNLTLVFGWDTPQNAKRFFESTELQTTMQNAGVAEKPTITFMEESAHGTL